MEDQKAVELVCKYFPMDGKKFSISMESFATSGMDSILILSFF